MTNDETLTLPQQIASRDGDRLGRYDDNLSFYQGSQWPEVARRGERRLTLNYGRAFVDKSVSYLMGEMSFAVDPLPDAAVQQPAASGQTRPSGGVSTKEAPATSPETARAAEEALYAVRDANNLEQLDFDTELDTAVLGDGCYKVYWDRKERTVRVTAPDVKGIFAWWAAEDFNSISRVASRYQLSAEQAHRRYGYEGNTDPVTAVEGWTRERFEFWIEGELIRSGPNPYRFIPFVIFPNMRLPKQFWGISDLEAFKQPAKELNRAVSALSRIIELSGNPIAVLENVDKAEDIAVSPGAIWELPEQARAYLLDLLSGGGVRLHVDYIDLLYRALHDLSETPRASFGDNRRGLSGVALEMELQPLLQKVKRKRLIRTGVYRRRNEMILRLMDRFTGTGHAPHRTRVLWGSVLPEDRARLIDDEVKLVAARIHARRTAMDNLGTDDAEAEIVRVHEDGRAPER